MVREEKRTNNPPRILFSSGSSSMPRVAGRVFIMYRRRRKPGTSIVIQATFPGMLKMLLLDVLPVA